jgi:hypothetical protein
MNAAGSTFFSLGSNVTSGNPEGLAAAVAVAKTADRVVRRQIDKGRVPRPPLAWGTRNGRQRQALC